MTKQEIINLGFQDLGDHLSLNIKNITLDLYPNGNGLWIAKVKDRTNPQRTEADIVGENALSEDSPLKEISLLQDLNALIKRINVVNP